MFKPYNVLILCTGNSARSILAEALLTSLGDGQFKGYSADSFPKGQVHPLALELLQEEGFDTTDMRSKSWDEFATPDAPWMDFVFTVCDLAAGEVCPIWPGHPVTAHWGIPDPAAVEGSSIEKKKAFRDAYRMLSTRIALFGALPLAKLDRMTLTKRVEEIGRLGTDANQGMAS